MSFIGDREKKYSICHTRGDDNNNGVIDLSKIWNKVQLKKKQEQNENV